MYAPWRHGYVTDSSRKGKKDIGKHECVFCTQVAANDDDKYYVLKRFKYCFVMMNYYPYNTGHLMVLPYVHCGLLTDLTPEVRADMMEALAISQTVIGAVLNPEGFNMGINLGIAGGGGIPSHLHIHILPRWRGDTNFLEIIGETKLISADFVKTFNDLKAGFARVAV